MDQSDTSSLFYGSVPGSGRDLAWANTVYEPLYN